MRHCSWEAGNGHSGRSPRAWKMVPRTKEVVATGETSNALGPDPVGYIIYQPDGQMMALVVRSDREPPAGLAQINEEKVRLFDSMLASGLLNAGSREGGPSRRGIMESSLDRDGLGSPLQARWRYAHDQRSLLKAPSDGPRRRVSD